MNRKIIKKFTWAHSRLESWKFRFNVSISSLSFVNVSSGVHFGDGVFDRLFGVMDLGEDFSRDRAEFETDEGGLGGKPIIPVVDDMFPSLISSSEQTTLIKIGKNHRLKSEQSIFFY